jgi:hypothetical protein
LGGGEVPRHLLEILAPEAAEREFPWYVERVDLS